MKKYRFFIFIICALTIAMLFFTDSVFLNWFKWLSIGICVVNAALLYLCFSQKALLSLFSYLFLLMIVVFGLGVMPDPFAHGEEVPSIWDNMAFFVLLATAFLDVLIFRNIKRNAK